MLYTYPCKKTGREYSFETKAELNAQDAYAWRRGVREYMDNYHASVTKDGLVTSKGKLPWIDGDKTFEQTVIEFCEEAQAKFNAGDVPVERGQADPKAAEARKQVAEFAKVAATPDEIAAALAFISKQRTKSGQTQKAA